MTAASSLGWRSWALVGLGGALGALARAGLSHVLPSEAGSFPWTVWAINVAGCFGIGVLVYALVRPGRAPVWLRPLVGTGFLGGFTTFSAFAHDAERLLAAGQAPLALTYIAASFVAGILAAACGAWVGTVCARRRFGVPPGNTVTS